MAIGLDLTSTEFGISFPEAYGRIVGVNIMRQNTGSEFTNLVGIDLAIYANVNGANMEHPKEVAFDRLHCDLTLVNNGDILSNCYAWLMTQEKYLTSTVA